MQPDVSRLQLQSTQLYESARALSASLGSASTSWDDTSMLVGRLQLVCFALTEVVERLPAQASASHKGPRRLVAANRGGLGSEAPADQRRDRRNQEAFEIHALISAEHLLLAGEQLTMAFNAAFHVANATKCPKS